MSFDNPFYHRGAIRQEVHFQGRNAETSQILGLLRNGQSVSVIGRAASVKARCSSTCAERTSAKHTVFNLRKRCLY